METRPLEGIRIIEMASHGACPSSTRILTDWGAEVIKIEPFAGDAARGSGMTFGVPVEDVMNPHFDMLNMGKKSVALNMKTEEGKAVMDKLLRTANALVTNFRTGSLGRMGLDWEHFHEKYPGLVWAHLSGFGEEGPAAANAGFDTVAYYARSGAMIDFAENGEAPLSPPFGVGDMSAGSSLAGGIAAALFRQLRTGEGSKVTISLYGQSIWAHGLIFQGVANGVRYPKSRRSTRLPLNNTYKCSDGEWLMISVLQYDRYFRQFFTMIGREDLIDDDRFNTMEAAEKNNTELISIIDEAFRGKTREEWMKLLKEADIAHDKINHLTDAIEDEQALVNGFLYYNDYPDGRRAMMAMPPVQVGEAVEPKKGTGPALGGDTEDVLTGLGYSREEIEKLVEDGAVRRS